MRKFFTTCASGLAALALFGSDVLAGAQAGSAVYLVCEPETSAPVCNALSRSLSERAGGHTVVRLERDSDISQPARFTIYLRQDPETRHRLSGNLVWNDQDGKKTRGPKVELSIMDREIGESAYTGFAQELLRRSDLPF